MGEYEQLGLFDDVLEEYTFAKPVRLISFFSGIEAQFKALSYLGKKLNKPVESYKTCEWAYNSIIACNAIHNRDFTDYSEGKTKEEMIEHIRGISVDYNKPLTDEQLNKKPLSWIKSAYNNCIANHNLINIMDVKGEDLEIVDTDNYEYILTYSFPCQDLSLAGKRAGMDVSQKEGGTRSGLLWEFERIIGELTSEQRSATILIMENVPQIHSDKDMPNFIKWQERLEELGYVSFWKDLNAKDYGIPQNRDRTFMVSVYGKQYHYKFPLPFKRELTLKDMLEDKVDEKYYLSKKMIDYLTGVNQKESKFDRGSRFASSLKTTNEENIAGCITTAAGQRPTDNFITDDIKVVGNYMPSGHNAGRVVDTNGIAPTVMENQGTVNAVAEYQGTYDYAQSDTLRPTEKDRFHENAEVSGTVLASGNQNGVVIRNNTEQGYLIAEEGDGINIGSRMHHQRGNVQPGMAQTLKTSMEVGVLDIPKQVGYIEKGTGQHQSNTIYSADGLSPTLTASDKKEPIKFLMEESLFTETEASLFTEDGNIRRYLGSDQIDEFKEGQMATTTFPNGYGHGTRTHNESITLNTIDRPVVKNNLRIRKLTPCEATRLMGFTDLDYEHIKETGLGDGAVYHCMGDSIVVCVLIGIFAKLYGVSNKETEKIIKDYIVTIKEKEKTK